MKRVNFYDQSLNRLWDQVIEMGVNVEKLLEEALDSLVNKDPSKLTHINELEETIDKLNEKIEMQALELISLQQPTPEDLRKLAAFMRIIKELERVGDLGVNLGEAVVRLEKMGDYFKPLIDIPKMCRLAIEMICKALKAYRNQDTSLTEEICLMEEEVDEMYGFLKDELVEYMKKDVKYIDQSCQFLLIVRDLERIGDHAENIAEMVNYMVVGKKTLCD
ncbi:MAG: phosphate signaling complex protein PhoU [Clostridia bacterium]|nr:phosphate signaling complex protein PhoU [Clostridia bacterium]